MSKIKKVDEFVSYSISTTFTKDLLNGKHCNGLGFRELYEKLFGANKFNKFRDDLIVEFEEEYFKQSPYKIK